MKKRNYKKLLALLLATIMSCTLLAGCGGSEGNSGAEGGSSDTDGTAKTAVEVTEPITITLWHASGSGANGNYMEAVVKAFNETNEYGITVETVYVEGYDALFSKVSTALAGNEAPELAVFADQAIPTLYSKGVFADMSAYVERDNFDLSNFIGATADYVEHDGQVITFPFNRSTPVVYYNKDVWAAAGMTPSTNITELYQQAEQIAKANSGMYGLSMHSDPFYLQESLVRSLGSEGLISNDGESIAAIDDGNLEKVLTDWKAGIDAGYMPTPSVTNSTVKLREMLYNGELATYIESSGGMANIVETAKEGGVNVGVAYYPSYGDAITGCGGCNMAVIGKGKTDQQIAASWEFIKFISSDEWVAERAITTGYIPVTKTAAATEAVQNYWAENPDYKVAYAQAEWAQCMNWSTKMQEYNKYLNTAFSYVIQDKSMTPKEATQYLEKQAMILFE